MLLWGEKTWRTVDDAIREATARFVHGARAIDYGQPQVDGHSEAPAVILAAQTQVLAILGRFDWRRERLLAGYAHGLGYTAMAEALGIDRKTARLWHQRARDEVRERMEALGLLRE